MGVKGDAVVLFCKQNFLVLAIILMLAVLFAPNTNASENGKSRLLLLYSYHPTFQTTDKILQGLRHGLGNNNVEIEVEYMDSKSLFDETVLDNFYRSLRYKLSRKAEYDFVVTSDDNALRFALTHQSELFAGKPITFLGVNNIELATAQNANPWVTGVVEAASLDANIQAARSLFPAHQELLIISDGTTSGRADSSKITGLLSRYPDLDWQLLDLSQYSWQEFANRLNQIDPQNATLLLLSAYRDRTENSLAFFESLHFITSNTDAPILHPYEHGMGQGVLGGIMVSHYQQGLEAGRIVSRYLQGTPVQQVRVLDTSPNVPIFDFRQILKHNVRVKSLPPNADIRYRAENFFVTYSTEIIIMLLFLVIILLAHTSVRNHKNRLTTASEKKLRTILDNIDAFVYLKDPKGKYLFVNKALRDQVKLSLPEIVGKDDFQVFDKDTAAKIVEVDHQVLDQQRKYCKDESFWRADIQQQQDVRTSKIPLIDEQDNIYAICGVSFDITAQKRHERLLEQATYYDSLTGLPNRLAFMDKLQQAMRQSEENNTWLHLAFIDLNNFKQINEEYGHEFGDQVIKQIVARVRHTVSDQQVIARLGGDEFYLLFESEGDGQSEIQRILDNIAQPLQINNTEISVDASAGSTRYPQSVPLEPEHLMRQVEQALFVAKGHRNNPVQQFVQYQQQGNPGSDRFKQLLEAFASRQFELYYQPKVSLINGGTVGVEALIRWHHPEEGILSPALFLPDIERYNLIKTLDDWVVDAALRQANQWHQEGCAMPISINLSHTYFRQTNLVQLLKGKLAQYPDLPASLIEIEIVETNALDNLNEVADTIRSCRELDIHFSLDDFGTGYSSLTYLQQLPVGTLKVDRSFVMDMLDNPTDMSILEGIMGFCRAFDLIAVAEGVESLEHGTRLKEMGYHIAQGFGIARPMPESELKTWMENWMPPQEWN